MFWCFNPALNVPQEDEKFLTEVFAQLTDDATEDSKRRELASFKKFFLFLLFFFLCFFLDICWNLKVVAFHNHVWEMSPEMAVGTVIFIWDRFNYFDLCISHLYCHLSISFFFLLSLGELRQRILCVFTNVAASKQGCVLQNSGKSRHFTCSWNSNGTL